MSSMHSKLPPAPPKGSMTPGAPPVAIIHAVGIRLQLYNIALIPAAAAATICSI